MFNKNCNSRKDSVSTSSIHSRGSLPNKAFRSNSFVDNDYESTYRTPISPSFAPSEYYYYPSQVEGSISSDSYTSRNTFHKPHAKSIRSEQQFPEEKNPLVFPPTTDMKQRARNRLLEIESKPLKVLYAGDVTYKTDKGLLSKTKHVHFVLTHKYLLVYKTAQKARAEIDIYHDGENNNQGVDKSHILLNLAHIYAIHAVVTATNTCRIDHLHPQSNQALSYTFTVENSKECKQWIQALISAVSIHHPSIETINTNERYGAIDRVSKQNDVFENTDDMNMYKVVFKEKRYKSGGGDSPREFFLPVILVFGKFSFYLLPATTVMDEEYLKTVERDRFGYLSIESIRYDGSDDTVFIQVRQINRKSRQLVFASCFCKDILHYFCRSIQSILPLPGLFQLKVPENIKKTKILPFRIVPDPEDEMTGRDDEDIQTFNIVLRAYTAALNLNKSRFHFTIDGPLKQKRFVLLPPNEINSSLSIYQKYELLALFRTIQANTCFQQVCFSGHPLDALENWKMDYNDGWSVHMDAPLQDNVLSNEIYLLLSGTKTLRKLDFSQCSMGSPLPDGTSRTTSAITAIGQAMQTGNTFLSRLSLGQNKISEADFISLMDGIQGHRKSIKEFYLPECGLDSGMVERVLGVLFKKNPEQMISLDLSSDKDMTLDPDLVAKIIPTFKRLECFLMRGYNLLNPVYKFALESSRLSLLDLSGSKLNRGTVSRLCQWIQQPSFRKIEALHLTRCGLNGRFVYELLCSISRSGNRQMHLNLAENPIMKEVMYLPKLYSAIVQGEGPSSISFAGTEWDDPNLCEFIDCLRDNQTICRLTLSDIKLRDTKEVSSDTVHMLTSLFERNTTLRELQLNYSSQCKPVRSHFSLSDPKPLLAVALTQALYGLRHNCVLQHLDISGLNMGDAGAMTLSRVLKTNRTLQSIHLDDNSITIEGYRHLVKVIQETASQVIEMPIPRSDVRFQLSRLAYRIEELVLSQNEAQFFLIHTVSGDKKRAKTHELEMLIQERKSCELSLKSIEGVVHSLMCSIQKNLRQFEEQQDRSMEFQLQAQAAAQELAVAQVRLQCRSFSSSSSSSSSIKSSYEKSAWNRKPNLREPIGKQHYFHAQLPNTPSVDDRYELLDTLGPLSPPLASYSDDPGFIEDFGYVDDFELDDDPCMYFQNNDQVHHPFK
ncbi:unnamed protein product [Rhizopus stolonifer]